MATSTSESQTSLGDGEKRYHNDKSIDDRIHQQLVYKDNRIIDLNNVILDKERQILDLQERVREQGEVANVKNQALRIVQQKFEEINRERKDMSTETDNSFVLSPSTSTSYPARTEKVERNERRARSSSPGHAIANRRTFASGTFSPPPIDPPIDTDNDASFIESVKHLDVDGIKRKSRKRVTFDLPPSAYGSTEELASALTEASSENSFLRKQIEELNGSVEKIKEQYEQEISKYSRDAKTAGLKARVVATARIKSLEETLEECNRKHSEQVEKLQAEVDTLRSSREWELEQNGQFREQIAYLKEKSHKLNEELDVSEKAKRQLDDEIQESKKIMELMVDDLLGAENLIEYHETQKRAIFEDVDRLKDAILAQDRFIEILEADIVIYEQHIGLLRESLGASKIDHRALIKSKAFETKLLALEKEKEMINRKSSEDRLKTKALDKKCQLLVQENEKLMEKLCELEMQRGEEDIQAKLKNQIEELNQRINDEKSRSIALQVAKEKVEEELAREKLSFENQVIALQQAPQHVVEPEAPDYLIREIEHLREKLSTAIREAEDLRAENFDLQMSKASTAPKETPKDEDYSEEVVREIKAKLEAVTEELSESLEAVESLKKEKQAIRVELDNARLSISETKEVREQVIRLKEELDQERETGRQNWEEACKRMAIPDANSRKNSIEVQYQQYTIAFEEKIEALQKALEDAKGTIAQDKEEKKKLKAALRQLRDKKEVKEEPKVEKLEVQLQQAAPAPDQSQADAVEMKRQIDELQLEAKLSGELNVELGRAMLEMEKKIDLMRLENDSQKREEETTVMELRLHEMMVQELSEEIENLKASLAQSSAPNACERCETFGEIIENLRQENKSLKAELDRVRQQMEGLGVERVSEREELDSMHDVEVRRLCTAIEDARREVSDLEQKLLLNEEALQKSLTTSKQYSHQSTTTDESSVVSNDNVTRGFYSDDEPTTSQDDQNRLIEENAILRECIDESNKAQGGMSQDIAKLLELKEELETAVNALKAEVWSLNGQLKSHLIDRENLEDRLCDLEDRVEKEKKRADGLDVELQEQVELTEKAQQRAAQAENESNRRLAECLEMENRREEIEKAYASLSEYYNQLQSAYNVIYAKVHTQQQEQLLQSAPQQLTLDDSELVPILLELMTVLEIDSDSAQGTTERLQLVVQKVKSVLNEVAEYRSALAEQKRISEAIQDRLETLEAEVERGATASSKERIQELEGEIEWKQEECVSLKRRISEMEKALDVLAVKGNEDEAAKLATRQADVDSLFRTNAELAHTNVRLQNEVDEKDEVRLTAERRHQEELLALRNEIAELEDKVRDLQVKLTESHSTDVSSDEQKRLQELLDEQTKEMLERQRQNSLEVKELQKKIGTLESQLAESQANSASLDEQQRLQGIVEELKKEMAAKENQNSAEKDDLEQKVEELEEQIHDLVKDLADSRRAPTVSQEQERLQTLVEQQKKEMFARERKSAVELEDLQQKIEELEEYIRDLEEKLAESRESQQKVVHETAQTSAKTEEDDNWGWGEDEDNVEQKVEEDPKKEELGPSLDDEVARLQQIERVLNQRIMSLEDQLLEVEEKYQDAEESLNEEKEKNAALQEEKEGLSRDASGLREKFEKTSANLNRTEQRAEETERHLREEIETVTKKLQEQEKLEENVVNEQQADAWDDWNDQEDQKPLKPEVKEEPADEDNWGWGEDEPADPVETSSLNKDEVAELNEQLRELAVAQTNLEKDLQAREALILTLEEQLKEANEKYQTLNDTLNELELKFERKEQELEESEKNAQKVKNELLKMREQSDLLKDSEARLLDQADDFATNMEKYSNECQTLRKQLTEVESRRNEVDPVALKEKEDEVQRLRHELEEVEKVLKCLEQKHEAVLQQEEQMKKELKTLKDQNDLLKDSEARLIDQADDYATHMEKYSNECQRLKKQLQERMVDPEAVYEKQVEVEIKSRKLEQMEQFLKDAEQKHAAALRQKEANISQLRQDQGLLEREIEDLKLRIEVVEKERDASKKALSDLKSKIAARSPAGSRPSTPRTRLAPPARHPDPVAEVAEPPAEPAEFRSSAFSPVIPQSTMEPLRRRTAAHK